MYKYFLIIIISFLQLNCASPKREKEKGPEIVSSYPELANKFNWAKDKARSFVQTGKEGPVNVSEASNSNTHSEDLAYIPSYWAGYPLRTAFYSRDFCHQLSGAHLLGLETENFTMLKAFATSADVDKKWFPLWAINFDGSPYSLDYRGNDNFVREIPAVFELVEKAYQLFCWTGDKRYIFDEDLWKYYTKAVTDFIDLHDTKMPNGVAEGSSGGIFQGVATYNEQHGSPLIEAGDEIACQYKAFWAYAKMAGLRGEKELSAQFSQKASDLKLLFNNEWGVKNTDLYNRGYSFNQEPIDGWGKENSWFMPMKGITDMASDRTQKYLDFIDERLESKDGIPANIEAISYIPELFFQYHQNKRGWKWMKYIMSHINQEHAASALTGKNGNYPEVSFVLLSNVVEGLLGVVPDAANNGVATISNLTGEVQNLCVENIKIGNSTINVEHGLNHSSRVYYREGKGKLHWKAGFIGHYTHLFVDGVKKACLQGVDFGQEYSYLVVELSPETEVTITTK